MSDPIDTLTEIHVESAFVALLAFIDRMRSQIDHTATLALLERISQVAPTADDLAELESLIDRHDGGAFLDDELGSFFGAVVALAGAAVGYTSNANDTRTRGERDRMIASIRAGYITDANAAIRETARRMATARGSAASRARQIARVVGLGPAGAASLHSLREVLFAYINSPTRTMPAQVVGSRTIPPQIVRQVDPRGLISRYASNLSQPQRAMLAKVMTPALDERAVEKMLSRHAAKLVRFRARSFVQHQARHIAELAKLSAWRAAQRVGALPSDQRRYWQTARDERVRHSHAEVPAMNAAGVALDEPFTTPFGPRLAPPLEINCRCKAVLRKPA